MKPFTLLLWLFTICIASLGSANAAAPEEPDLLPVLQLDHILAPTQARPGSFTTVMRPFTPILVVPRDFNTPLVCQRAPRVAEALLQYFLSAPIPVDRKRHLDQETLQTRTKDMAMHVNRALGLNAVSEVYLIEGGKAMNTGVAQRMAQSKAASCGPVLKEYEKHVMELLKK